MLRLGPWSLRLRQATTVESLAHHYVLLAATG